MSKKVITFGEIMLRLATPDYLRFCQANQFNATFGGGEANVAASLANYGMLKIRLQIFRIQIFSDFFQHFGAVVHGSYLISHRR